MEAKDTVMSGRGIKDIAEQAIKDSREGKELDLADKEFEIFCSIENMYIEKITSIKDVECQQRVERIFREITQFLNKYRIFKEDIMRDDWKALKKREEVKGGS